MPIFEFRCLSCNHIFERLSIRQEDTMEMRCPQCEGTEIERVLSRVSYARGGDSGGDGRPTVNRRSCAGGTCATIDIPGPSR